MKANLATFALLLLLPLRVSAQSACADFDAAIELSLKRIASSYVEGLTDNSAPRQALRNSEMANELATININITLQIQNKCPVRKTSINWTKYVGAALGCRASAMKDEKDSPACDINKWDVSAETK